MVGLQPWCDCWISRRGVEVRFLGSVFFLDALYLIRKAVKNYRDRNPYLCAFAGLNPSLRDYTFHTQYALADRAPPSGDARYVSPRFPCRCSSGLCPMQHTKRGGVGNTWLCKTLFTCRKSSDDSISLLNWIAALMSSSRMSPLQKTSSFRT